MALDQLPPELIQRITDVIPCARDLVAWSMATGVDVGPAIRRIPMLTDGRTMFELLECGAPLDVARASIKRSLGAPRLYMTPRAARGGRLDVVKYVWIDALDRQRVPKSSDPQSTAVAEWQWWIIEDALRIACRRAHVDVALWLLTRLPYPHDYRSRKVVEAGLLEAARAGHLHVIEAIHTRRMATVGACDCSMDVGQIALQTDQVRIVAWLHARRVDTPRDCLGRGHDVIDKESLNNAISRGRVHIARWLSGAERPSWVPIKVSFQSMVEAGSEGHLHAIALAHDEGLHPCTVEVLAALVKCKPQRAIDALLWAAGEPTVDIHVPVPDGVRRPIAAWGDPAIAYAALGAPSNEPFAWLLGRPDAHRLFTVGAVRWALTQYPGYARALRVCAAGLVSFDDCDALATVITHFEVADAMEAIKAGAPWTQAALEAALLRKDPVFLQVLCRRFGTNDVPAAVRKIAGTPLDGSVIAWLRVNVPLACIADLRAALLVGPRRCVVAQDPCACPACNRRP
ncbi:hypothetical protein psal_cds_1286 [Pandoravirus salinus]|uniref:Ankyrin repeat domain containing protein n=1 Tax=Pandoravirus salinus TaxID=1349410 RepID=S4VZ59_9VIRU|nr:hypothetical protein psal_cds_1286 [Pandoravirus salinus]AGO85648.1 hypothetical protein psal_cds_1286 [Pandoravirus salinus]